MKQFEFTKTAESLIKLGATPAHTFLNTPERKEAYKELNDSRRILSSLGAGAFGAWGGGGAGGITAELANPRLFGKTPKMKTMIGGGAAVGAALAVALMNAGISLDTYLQSKRKYDSAPISIGINA